MQAMTDSTKEARALAETLADAHEQIFADDAHTTIKQHCMLFTDQGNAIIECPWNSGSERADILSKLASAIKESQAKRYAFWAEVWLSRVAVSDRKKAVQPRKDPNRQEFVMTLVCERDHEPVIILQAIERDDKGGVTKLVREPMDADLTTMGGDLAELFDE